MSFDVPQASTESNVSTPIDFNGANLTQFPVTTFHNGLGSAESQADEVVAQTAITNLPPAIDFTSGSFVVGKSGQVSVDYLIDGGQYEGEVALFSLNGMDELTGIDFIREAAVRALDDPLLDPPRGHIIISDRTQGAKYNNNPGENRNWNQGSYSGPKTFDFASGDQLALMFVPDGTVEEVRNNPAVKGKTKPLFSIAALNPKAGSYMGQIAYATTDSYTLALEDQSFEGASDRDYNDLIFQITGVTSTVASLDKIIDPVQDWRKTVMGTDLIDYVSLPVAPNSDVKYRPHELLVKFPIESTNAEIAQLMAEYRATEVQWLVPPDKQSDSQLHQWRIVTFEPSVDILALQIQFAVDARITATDLNVLLETAAVPNDPAYGNQWALPKISASAAWDITQGSDEVVVAVLDTGIDYNHPDLVQNIWVNSGEIANNGRDDDGNGYIDDFYGYDFSDGNIKPTGLDTYIYPDADTSRDSNGHGTHVAGVIGAVTNNNVGISGVSPNVKLMPVQFLSDGSGTGTVVEAVEAIHYALNNEADIINASFGGYLGNWGRLVLRDALLDTLDEDVLVVTAAGNRQLTDIGGDGNRSGNSGDNDTKPFYPASFDLPNVISVAATNQKDELAAISNYGKTTVHLAAPGINILSTLPTAKRPNDKWIRQSKKDHYGLLSGTSMATPHVTATAALMLALNPTLSAKKLKEILLNTVDPLDSLQGKTSTAGRLNVMNALAAAETEPESATLEWIRNIRTSNDEVLNSIALDSNDNAYVVGITKGDLYAANSGGWDGIISQYDSEGNVLWTEQLGTINNDYFNDVAVDSNDNFYVVGSTFENLFAPNSGRTDAILMKYDKNKNLLWGIQTDAPLYESFTEVKIDKENNIYVIGQTADYTPDKVGGSWLTERDSVVSKYSSDGQQLWSRQFSTPHEDDYHSADLDQNGNIFIYSNMHNSAGTSPELYSTQRLGSLLIKYDQNGNLIDTEQSNDPGKFILGMKVDADNNRYVLSAVAEDGDFSYSRETYAEDLSPYKGILQKYDAQGNQIWQKVLDYGETSAGYALEVDQNRNIYTVLFTNETVYDGSAESYNKHKALIVKLDANGDTSWTKEFDLNGFESSYEIAVDSRGTIYVPGNTSKKLNDERFEDAQYGDNDTFLARFDQLF